MNESRSPAAVAPAIVACLCALATVLALGGYLGLRGELDESAARLAEERDRIDRLEKENRQLAQAFLDLDASVRHLDALRKALDAPREWAFGDSSPADPLEHSGEGSPAVAEGAGPVEDVPPLLQSADSGDGGRETGRVLVVSTLHGRVMIDRGQRDGVRVDDQVLILRQRRVVGEARVEQAPHETMAVCRLLTAEPVRTGDRVRVVGRDEAG